MLRTIVTVIVTIVVLVGTLALLAPSIFNKIGKTQTVLGASNDSCAGVRETITLGDDASLINDGSDCDMSWYIDKGPVFLVDNNQKDHQFDVAGPYAFNAVKWKAKKGETAKIYAWFCPKPTTWVSGKGCEKSSSPQTAAR